MSRRTMLRSAITGMMIAGLLGASAAAQGSVEPNWVGHCPGNWQAEMQLHHRAGVHDAPYASSPIDFYLSDGQWVYVYETAYNKYGNAWQMVGYATRTQDHCGWVNGKFF